MKTKLSSVTYLGFTAMERRFSNAMLPWLLREIRATGIRDKLSIAVEDGYLKAYNGNFEPVIVHRLVDIIRASQVPGRPEELFYILYNEKEQLLNCYLFKAATVLEVTDLFTQMRDPSSGAPSPLGSTGSLGASVTRNIGFSSQNSTEHLPWASPAVSLPGNCNTNLTTEAQSNLVRSNSNASALTSLSADLSPSDSHFFEVLYIGKVRISQRKVPESLIDDALTKFAQHQAEKALRRRHSLISSTGTSLYSSNSRENLTDDKKTEVNDSNKTINMLTPSTTPLQPNNNTWKSVEALSEKPINKQIKSIEKPSKEIEDEFDMFTKERVEKTVKSPQEKVETKIQRPNSIPLEPSVVILNVPKVNLKTVEEEEKNDLKNIKNNDIKSIISETATNLTQFCEDATKSANREETKNNNPFSIQEPFLKSYIVKPEDNVLFIREDTDIDPPMTNKNQEEKDPIQNNKILNIQNEFKNEIAQSQTTLQTIEHINNNIVKVKPQDSPKKINFEEISRKPKIQDGEKKNSMPENKPFLRDRSASIGTIKTPIAHLIGEQNRTMLFQVGRSELRLISPDRKQILLHRAFKDVASCVVGRVNTEHFGFVCRETNDSYACYVFQCESDSVATEVVNAIRQAFVAHAELVKKTRDKSPNMTCEHCPMLWYHRLCHDVDGMNDKKTHAFILRRIEQLPDEEQDLIITKYQGGTNHMYETSDHNSFLMMLLRAHCEAKQTRHVHDTAENRSEFLNQYLGGSTIFMKAKRSLSSGFDHLLKRRASRDELGQSIGKKDNVLFIREDTDIDPPMTNKNQEEKDPIQNNKILNIQNEFKNEIAQSQTTLQTIEHINNNIVKVKPQDSPKKINFEEISRKPKIQDGEKKNSMPENKPFLRDRSASIGTIKTPIAHLIGEQNRTMLFQVGRSELRLISPDRKQILLHRAFKDVASCVVGRVNTEHFGFVCRETNDSYACYVFQCESDSVATEVVNAIRQAFVAHAELVKKTRDKSPNMTCEHCPMLWYHRLCHDVDGMNDKKTHAFILRRIEQLPDEEQDLIITKYQGGTNHMYETSDHNSFLMMLLRAHCEAKQTRHVHDTAENRSEFLNQYLGGSTIFMKAKRSLSSGFDHLLKRRASRDELGQSIGKKESSPLPTPLTESLPEPELLQPHDSRSKSLSPAVISQEGSSTPKHAMTPTQEEEEEELEEEQQMEENKEEGAPVNSPMMDIFLQVSDNRPAPTEGGSEPDYTWRHAIYQKVLQPAEEEGELSGSLLRKTSGPKGKRSKEELRRLWKMAIEQTLLLVRMEKENERLKEREESSAVRRIKLEYTELGVCDAGVVLMWDSLLNKDPSQPMAKVDRHMLTQAVMQGVPRMTRGAVWYFLAEQASLRAPPPDTRQHPHYCTPYRTLLAGLTKHQHAILIDLGRTFPKHEYFSSALGPGQLALYNILKAYSLVDPDVGYCQGLSFVAGVLLLHMEEAEAFILLRHLMFRRGLRKQYLPDMSALQVQLYQLSRLLRDHEPELHAKLEELDISPALYAAPWMLTLFTSQFPLGFVVRVFDLLFLESMDVIFSISLSILSAHKDGLMLCESCEEAAEYLKHKIPDMTPHAYRKIMKKVHALDISRQLSDYAVEYAVLREEMPRVAALTEENRTLHADKNNMTEQLDTAMDSITNLQKNQTRLESANKSLEQQLTLLSRYISATHKQELPAEIKRIVQNYSKKLSFSSKLFSSKFTNDDEEKRIPKTGISSPNLFAKIAENKETKESPERERKVFIMKKSQSVHSGLIANLKPLKEETNELTESLRELGRSTENVSSHANRTNSINNFTKNELTESLKELGKKNAGFFANTHEQIRQERLFEKQLKQNFDENLKKLDDKITTQSYMDDLSIFQSRKCMSLNLNSKNDSKMDSGFVTPMTPDKKSDSNSSISHPLSDVDVEIKFDGQSTKLKQIRPLKPCVENKT